MLGSVGQFDGVAANAIILPLWLQGPTHRMQLTERYTRISEWLTTTEELLGYCSYIPLYIYVVDLVVEAEKGAGKLGRNTE